MAREFAVSQRLIVIDGPHQGFAWCAIGGTGLEAGSTMTAGARGHARPPGAVPGGVGGCADVVARQVDVVRGGVEDVEDGGEDDGDGGWERARVEDEPRRWSEGG